MRPSFSSNDIAHVGRTYSYLPCKFKLATLALLEPCPNLQNDFVGEPSQRIEFSLVLKLPTLLVHLSHVVGVGSNPEVFPVAARPSSDTGVENAQAVRGVASGVNNPRNPVGVEGSDSSELLGDSRLSISVLLDVSGPRPAFVLASDYHMGPKQIFEVVRQYLIQGFGGYNLRSHNICRLLCLLCHAPGMPIRGGTFIYPEEGVTAT